MRRAFLACVLLFASHAAVAAIHVSLSLNPAGPLPPPASVQVHATAVSTDDGRAITSLKLYRNGTEIGSAGSGTLSVQVTGLGAGQHVFTALATDNLGDQGSAPPRTLVVQVPPNVPPAVTLDAPTGAPFIAPATVGLTATASDSDGQVTKVEFLRNGSVIGTDTAPPYAFSWTNAPVGTHTLTARATDNASGVTTSAPRTVVVAQSQVKGHIDGVPYENGQYIVYGWACSTGRPQSIQVRLYAGGAEGSGTLLGTYTANVASEPGVATACQSTGTAYRFKLPLSVATRNAHANRRIHVHGISPVGAPNAEIANSGVYAIPGPLSVTRRYVYDERQRLCRSIEPEAGSTVYQYDAAGNVTWSASGLTGAGFPADDTCRRTEAEASGRVVRRTYDQRGRLLTLRFPDTRGDQDWTYWPDGLPKTVTTVNVPGTVHPQNNYAYDQRRRLTTETQVLPAWYTYSLGYGYDANGHLATVHYPSGMTLAYAPNALGQPTQAVGSWSGGSQPFATLVTHHPNGAIAGFKYGNEIVHAMTQNARQLPDEVKSSHGSTQFHFDAYDYDRNGNVAAISDGATGENGIGDRTMSYDGLDRLVRVQSPMYAASGNEASYAYNGLDDLVEVKAPGRHHFHCYDPNRRLTNVKTGGCGGATVTGLGYDANGNVTVKNSHRYDFDHGNRLREVYTGTHGGPDHVVVERYRYDAHGRRVLAVNWQAGTVFSQYGQDGKLYYQQNARTGQQKTIDHVHLGGSLIAQREVPIGGGASTFKYQHTDALSSPVVVTGQGRNVIERVRYEPYGKALTPPPNTGNDRPGYTGHVEDRTTGLTNMQQRYYWSDGGVFLSRDPVTAHSDPVLHFNPYRYANNNPYKFTDPDGRISRCGVSCDDERADKVGRAGGPKFQFGGEGEHRPLTRGEAFANNFRNNIDNSPLGPGGKDAMHFVYDDLVDGVGDALDGDFRGAAAGIAIGLVAKPLKPLSGRLTYLYQKLGAKGEHLKFGITVNPATRYTATEMGGGRMNIIASGSRGDMLRLERNLHETLPIGPEERQLFYIQKQMEKGLQTPPY